MWFPQDEKQIDWDVALDEMATAGFSVMDTGPFGYFPTEPARLQEEMDARGFKVVAGTGWGILHKAEAWADTEKLFRSIGETHAAVGAEYVVHLPPMFRDEKTGITPTTGCYPPTPGTSTSRAPTGWAGS